MLAKPNVIFGYDDSGSMDSEVMLDTSDGVFWWNYDTGKGWDASGKLYRHVNLGEYWSSTWRRYFYLFPNGNGGGRNLKPDDPNGDWSLPPTSEFAWARSADYNPQYYNPAVTYKPGRTAHGYAAFANATTTAARGHPIYGGATNVVDLSASRAASTSTSLYFIAVNGMTLPAGASVDVCNGSNAGCGAWSAVGASDSAAQSGKVTRLSMAYWPATYWVKASGTWDCVLPAVESVGTDDCAVAPDGQKLRRIEIRPSNATYPSGRSYAAELQNFANWFQYYRKRRLMRPTPSMGKVLESLTGLRVGVIRSTTPADTAVTMYDTRRRCRREQRPEGGGHLLRDRRRTAARRRARRCKPHRRAVPQQQRRRSSTPASATTPSSSPTVSPTATPSRLRPTTRPPGAVARRTRPPIDGTLADIALSYYTNKLRPRPLPAGKVPTRARPTPTPTCT